MTWVNPALAQLERLTSREAASGLKAALAKGSQAAVAALGRTDGFLANPRVRIPLPPALARVDTTLRRFGMGRQADELVRAMNRAAEAAVPEARALFLKAVQGMSIADAKGILQGGDGAATAYFRRHTETELRRRFLPIVRRATARVGLARYYNAYAGRAAAFGLLEEGEADLDAYVTGKALEGLFLVLADEEHKIRADPARAGTAILRKVFGALKG